MPGITKEELDMLESHIEEHVETELTRSIAKWMLSILGVIVSLGIFTINGYSEDQTTVRDQLKLLTTQQIQLTGQMQELAHIVKIQQAGAQATRNDLLERLNIIQRNNEEVHERMMRDIEKLEDRP